MIAWRVIAEAPDYEVSDTGRIRRARDRSPVTTSRGGKGYLSVALRLPGGRWVRRAVSRVVLIAFKGPPPTPRHEAAHWDRNKLKNEIGNLRWATSKENRADMNRHGTLPIGEKHGRALLNEKQVIEVKRRILLGEENGDIARDYGVHRSTIRLIRIGRNWRHVPWGTL